MLVSELPLEINVVIFKLCHHSIIPKLMLINKEFSNIYKLMGESKKKLEFLVKIHKILQNKSMYGSQYKDLNLGLCDYFLFSKLVNFQICLEFRNFLTVYNKRLLRLFINRLIDGEIVLSYLNINIIEYIDYDCHSRHLYLVDKNILILLFYKYIKKDSLICEIFSVTLPSLKKIARGGEVFINNMNKLTDVIGGDISVIHEDIYYNDNNNSIYFLINENEIYCLNIESKTSSIIKIAKEVLITKVNIDSYQMGKIDNDRLYLSFLDDGLLYLSIININSRTKSMNINAKLEYCDKIENKNSEIRFITYECEKFFYITKSKRYLCDK